MSRPHIMDAIHKAAEAAFGDMAFVLDGAVQSVREDLIVVLRHLPRDLTVGDLLRELEEA